MPFLDDTPTLEKLKSGQWRLAESVVYTTAAGERIEAPAGMVTDLASIPWGLWNLLPPAGDYAPAAIIHDHLYRTHKIGEEPITRGRADAVFLEAMEALGIGQCTRWIIYLAVRLGAWWAWPSREAAQPAAI